MSTRAVDVMLALERAGLDVNGPGYHPGLAVLARALAEAYRAGQLAMRERAAKVAKEHGAGQDDAECCGDYAHNHIRALEPEEPK